MATTDNSSTIVEGDYVLSDETTKVWDYTANTTYHNDVAGIGKDDGWNFFQKQSKSLNTNALVTFGLTDIATTNPANTGSLTDKSYLVWGHNNGALTTTTTAIPNVPAQAQCVTNERLNRTWKIVETGTVGTVEVALSKALIDTYFSTTNSQKVLVIADDASFSTNVLEVALNSELTAGLLQYRGTLDIDGTKYFTVADHKEIEWLGATANWQRGSGTNGSPNTDDTGRLLIVNSQSTTNHATLVNNVNVKCTYITANSKLVVPTNRFIEIEDDLVLDGEIRLVGDGQLVQTHTGTSKITGTGNLYKDQQAKVPNVYRYHYWSSPVTEVGANTFRVGEVMKDGTLPTSVNSNPLDINWIGGNNYDGAPGNYFINPSNPTPITIASYWIYTNSNDPGDGSAWTRERETGVIDRGEGYTMKSTGSSPQNFTFVGTPNDGTITQNINGSGVSSVLGNPYPSALDINKFLTDNSSSLDATVYFWEHTGEDYSTQGGIEGHFATGYQGGYSIRNLVMGVAASSASSTATNTFDWGNATAVNNEVFQQKSITIDNVTTTVEAKVSATSGVNIIDKAGASGTSGNVVQKNNGASTESVTITFDEQIDVSSIYLYNDVQNSTNNSIAITADNTNRNPVKTDNLITNTGKLINLSYSDVSSLTISYQNATNLVIDNLVFSLGNRVSLGNGTYTEPTNFMAVAQGFTVNSSASGGQIVFNNSQRVYRNNDYNAGGTFFFKNESKTTADNEIPILKLGMDFSNEANINLHRQLGISFKAGNTFAYDNGYDSSLFDLGATDMYWEFEAVSDKKLVIAGVQEITENLKIPLTLTVDKKQEITFGIDERHNFEGDLFLFDEITGNYYNLSEKIVLEIEKGLYKNRYFLAFKNVVLNTSDEIIKENNIQIFADNSSKEIVLKNKTGIKISNVEMYSLLGKRVAKWKNIGSTSEHRFKYQQLSDGFYIVKINTENGVFSKKIVLSNY